MLRLSQFDYQLPESRIANSPAIPRDHSKLLVLNRHTGKIIDDHFFNIGKYLQAGDVIIRNNSKVINARLIGIKDSGGSVEVLLNRLVNDDTTSCTWECLSKPGLKEHQNVSFEKNGYTLSGRCIGLSKDSYARLIHFNTQKSNFFNLLQHIGDVPLPPYIKQLSSEKIAKQYQTLYAQHEGSVAAPTAGLHFTPELDRQLQQQGINILGVTLHVGMGTFLPVKSENVTEHTMHEELYSVSDEVALALNQAKSQGKRIVSVGTTTTRVLETLANQSVTKSIISGSGSTDIFIFPPKKFQFVDVQITNFHLPKSTLLMLVAAFVTEPNTSHSFTTFSESTVGKAYHHAIKNAYRFFSFGDAMLIE